MSNFLFVYADNPQEFNCSFHNCTSPSDAINRTSKHTSKYIHMSQWIANSEETQRLCSEADTIVVERNFFGDCLTMISYWKVRGKSILAIFDDAYQIIHSKNVSYNFWKYGETKYIESNITTKVMNMMVDPANNESWAGLDNKTKNEIANEVYKVLNAKIPNIEKISYMKPLPLEQFAWGLKMVKGIEVVSQALADDWKHLNNTYLIHNYLEPGRYDNVQPLFPHDEKEIWVGWSGSLSHVDSFESSGLLKAFKRIIKKYDNVKILLTGDKRVFDLVDVPEDRKAHSPFVPADKYPALMKSIDIYTIPLFGEYDKRRSQIKPLECCALQIPWIATNFPNYNHLASNGIFTENGSKNWEDVISEMIENYPKHKERVAEEPYQFSKTQYLDGHIQERIDLYEKLMNEPYK